MIPPIDLQPLDSPYIPLQILRPSGTSLSLRHDAATVMGYCAFHAATAQVIEPTISFFDARILLPLRNISKLTISP